MWEEITKKEYLKKVPNLKPVESFTDMEGTASFGYGYPYVETIWGIGEKHVLKCVMDKEDRHQKEWDCKYYEKL